MEKQAGTEDLLEEAACELMSGEKGERLWEEPGRARRACVRAPGQACVKGLRQVCIRAPRRVCVRAPGVGMCQGPGAGVCKGPGAGGPDSRETE